MMPATSAVEPNDAPRLPAGKIVEHLAHELRQPLSALESIAFYLQMTAGQNLPDVSKHAERIRQMVESANWVLTDMHYLIASPHACPAAFDLVQLLEDLLAESWVTEGFVVCASIAEGLPEGYADAAQVEHLLRGVLQFLRRIPNIPGQLWLNATVAGDMLHLTVSAQAPDAPLGSVFDPFSSNQLHTCRKLAVRNQGNLDVHKDIAGRLEIRLELPVATPQA